MLSRDKFVKCLIILMTFLIVAIFFGILMIKIKKSSFVQTVRKFSKNCKNSPEFKQGYWEAINERDFSEPYKNIDHFDNWETKNINRIYDFKNLQKKLENFNNKCIK